MYVLTVTKASTWKCTLVIINQIFRKKTLMTFTLASSQISIKRVLYVVNKNFILKFCITGTICHDTHHLSFPLPFPVHLTIFVPISCSPCLYLSRWCFSWLLLHSSTWRTTCGLLLWLYLSQHLNQQKHVWNPADLFQSQLFRLSLTLQVKIHSCGDSEVFSHCCLASQNICT